MYSIKENPFGKFTEYKLVNTQTGEFVLVIPDFGATLNQVCLKKNNVLYNLLDGSSSYEELITEGKKKFKGSKLFPFPNRIKDGNYNFNGISYSLPINFPQEQNAIHGLVLEKVFKCIEKKADDQQAVLKTQLTLEEEKGYPFQVTVTIEFKLSSKGFECKTTIQNNGKQPIPIGDGWHPYFILGSSINECMLTLPEANSYEVDERMIPTGKKNVGHNFSKPTQIKDVFFDTGFELIDKHASRAYTVVEDLKQKVKVSVWQETGTGKYNYLQIYTPPDRKSIAIEPMTCPANSFVSQEGMQVLPSMGSTDFSFGIFLE